MSVPRLNIPHSAKGFVMSRSKYPNGQDPMLRYHKPYWWPYKTYVKERWIGRELLEVVSTEFRERSVEYYVSALTSLASARRSGQTVPKETDPCCRSTL
jgi:hypothetical protein